MTDRKELADIIKSEYVRAIDRKRPQDCWDAPADAIIAAGYIKPRTITTVEELDALPEGAVILPRFGRTWRRGLVAWDSGVYRWSSDSVASHGALPATVLYEGGAQ